MNPITSTVTKPEPAPEPVRPRLYVAIWHDGVGNVPWCTDSQPFLDHDRAARSVDGYRGARVIAIPTDAEIERDARIAEAHARYVAELVAEVAAGRRVYANAIDGRKVLVAGYYADVLSYEAAQQRTDSARAEWEAERSKA